MPDLSELSLRTIFRNVDLFFILMHYSSHNMYVHNLKFSSAHESLNTPKKLTEQTTTGAKPHRSIEISEQLNLMDLHLISHLFLVKLQPHT